MCSGLRLSSGQVGFHFAHLRPPCTSSKSSCCRANAHIPSNFVSQLAACAGGQINNDDSADDVKNVDLTKVNNHPCSIWLIARPGT